MTLDRRPLREDMLLRSHDALAHRVDILERRLAALLGRVVVGVTVYRSDTGPTIRLTFDDGGTVDQVVPFAWFAP